MAISAILLLTISSLVTFLGRAGHFFNAARA